MSVFEFETPGEKAKPDPVCPSKIIVLALARDHRGVRAKLLAETLHRRFPDDYHKPLVKFFHDIGWRDTLNRLRKASKKWDYVAPVIVFVNKKLIGDDDDFNLFIRQKHFLVVDPTRIQAFKNMSLLDKLQMDPLKTYVYFDVSIDYRPCGRMIFQIEGETMPESTKGFLQLCCSQKIPLPAGQYKRSKFAGSLIKRIVREGWVRIDTIDDERVYAKGKYEKPALTHDRRGILSMNTGPRGWLSSHIIITLDQHPWMDKMYRAIGVLIDGEHVLHMLENVDTTYENPNIDVVITDNGILHSPNLMTTEGFLTPEMRDASEKLKAFKDEYKSVLAAYVNTAQCLNPEVKVEPKKPEDEDVKIESNLNESDDEGVEVVQSGINVPESHASLLYSKSRITDFTATQSKVAMFGSMRSSALDQNVPSFREISSKRKSVIPSFGSGEMIGDFKSNLILTSTSSRKLDQQSTKKQDVSKSSKRVIKGTGTITESPSSLVGESEDVGEEEIGEDSEIKPQISEPDIQYTYVVPKEMVDMRTGYKTFSDGKRPEQYQKVGMKLPTKDQSDSHGRRHTAESLMGKPESSYEEPHQRIEKDGTVQSYELSKKAMAQVTPKLLLAWAQRVEEDEEFIGIEQAVNELLESAIKGSSQIDLEGHPLDAVSMEDTRERFHKCLLSLPTQLLRMLNDAMQEIYENQDDGTKPLVVTGESTSKVKLVTTETKKAKAASEDVISGIMFGLIDFTKRMIESSTELVPNMKNLDFVTSLIEDVILQRVHKFIEKKQKNDERFKKKLPYNRFFTPGDPKAPYMKDLRKTKSGAIGYYLDAKLLPKSILDVSEASSDRFAEISAKRLPIHIKDKPKKPPSSA